MPEQNDTPQNETDTKIYHDQRSVALRTTQSLYFVKEQDKTNMLTLLLDDYKEMQIVIVVKSKKKADALSVSLNEKGFLAAAAHGNHRQAQQQELAKKFNDTSLHILITTDMILQTLDLENIKLLLSHDLPEIAQTYFNRLALMKEQGVAMALVNPEDEPFLDDIEYNMKKEIEEKTVEGFVSSPKAQNVAKQKKDRSKKPRHRKNKMKKEQEEGL